MGSRRRVAALAAALLLAGCTGSSFDSAQAAQERRTCASLRERVAARGAIRFGIPGLGELDEEEKADALGPAVLVHDPAHFYATLEQELAGGAFGPPSEPTHISPASRLVDTCRSLGS